MINDKKTFRRIITRFCQLPLLIVPVIVLGLITLAATDPYDWISAVLFMRRIAVSMFTCYLIGSFIKLLYFKDRPEPQLYKNRRKKINASSFPSVHTAQATIVFISSVILAKFIVLSDSTHAVLKALILAACAFTFYFFIARSRLVLKKHFLIDVIFGTVLGMIAVAFTTWHHHAIIGIAHLILGK